MPCRRAPDQAASTTQCALTLTAALLQGFAKGMLEVADNLERAFEVAGEDAKRVQELDAERAKSLLSSLLDGLGITDKILLQACTPDNRCQ